MNINWLFHDFFEENIDYLLFIFLKKNKTSFVKTYILLFGKSFKYILFFHEEFK